MFRLSPEAKLCQSISIDGGILTFEYLDGTVEERVDKTAKLSTYRNQTWWKAQGDRFWYTVTARKNSSLVEKLGQIWKKNDDRWVWVRHKSKYQGRGETIK